MSWFDRSVKCPVCRADIRAAPVTAGVTTGAGTGGTEAAGRGGTEAEALTPNLDIG